MISKEKWAEIILDWHKKELKRKENKVYSPMEMAFR